MSDLGREDHDAIDRLLRRYRPYMARICMDMLWEFPEEVEDTLQEAQLALFARVTGGEEIRDVKSYAGEITRNACRACRRKKRRDARSLSPEDDVSTLDLVDKKAIDPVESALDRDLWKRVERTLVLLPRKYEQQARAVLAEELTGSRLAPSADQQRRERYTDQQRQSRVTQAKRIRAAARVLLHLDLDAPVAVDRATTCPALRDHVATAHAHKDTEGRLVPKLLASVVRHLRTCPDCDPFERDRTFEALRVMPFLAMPVAADEMGDGFELVSAEEGLPGSRRERGRRQPVRHSPQALDPQRSQPRRGRSYKGQVFRVWTMLLLLGALLVAVWPQTIELAYALVPPLAGNGRVEAAGPSAEAKERKPRKPRKPRKDRQDGAAKSGEESHASAGRTDTSGKSTVPRDVASPATGPDDKDPKVIDQQGEALEVPEPQPGQDQQPVQSPEEQQLQQPQLQQPQQQEEPQKQPTVVEARPVMPQQQQAQLQPVPATPIYTLTTRLTGYGAFLSATADGKGLGTCEQPGNADHECSWQVVEGAKVTLKASDELAEWQQGPCSGKSLTCTFTMNAAKTVVMHIYIPG